MSKKICNVTVFEIVHEIEEEQRKMGLLPNMCENILSPLNIPFIFTAICEGLHKEKLLQEWQVSNKIQCKNSSEKMYARISCFRLFEKNSLSWLLEAQNHIHIQLTCTEEQKAAYLKSKYFQVAQKLRKADFISESFRTSFTL